MEAYDVDSTRYHCQPLKAEKFFFYWKVQFNGKVFQSGIHFFCVIKVRDGDSNLIDMVMLAKNHSGYMAVGLSENGGMRGADQIIAFPSTSNSSSCSVFDYWSDHYDTPILDTHQHVQCNKTVSKDGDFFASFSRVALTNDPFDNEMLVEPSAFQSVIWSLGAGVELLKHVEYGAVSIDFSAAPIVAKPDFENDPYI